MNDALALALSGVSKRYSHFALEDVDLAVAQGTVMGFIGPNGAGKTTTLRIAMGLLVPDAGQVRVLGHPVPEEQVAAKWQIGFASEDLRLYKSRSLEWHETFLRSIYPDWDARYAETLYRRFDLKRDQIVKTLSHGQRVKAGLLMVLARRPRLVILDEPTNGLDPVARAEVLNELIDVVRDEDRAVLFSSHNTQDIEQLSDQITFIDRGRIIDSQDKDLFLERWRRLRLESDSDRFEPQGVDLHQVQQEGRLFTMTTSAFDEALPERIAEQGARVLSVERLTLEEIFVAEVMSHRGDSAQGGL